MLLRTLFAASLCAGWTLHLADPQHALKTRAIRTDRSR